MSCVGVDANLEQVKKGLAWFYAQYGHDEAVRAAESEAKAAGLGLWSRKDAIPPWEYRHGGGGKKSAGSKDGSATGSTAQPDEAGLIEHGHYTNLGGHVVHSPAHTATGNAPAGASAKCGDGRYSSSQHRRGTCPHHGGVEQWL